jgi:hypothetical protein
LTGGFLRLQYRKNDTVPIETLHQPKVFSMYPSKCIGLFVVFTLLVTLAAGCGREQQEVTPRRAEVGCWVNVEIPAQERMVLLDWGSNVLVEMITGELSRLLLRMGHKVNDQKKLAEVTRSLRGLLPPHLWEGETKRVFIAAVRREDGGPISFCPVAGYLGGTQIAVKLNAGGDFVLFGYEFNDGNLGYLVVILAERVDDRLKLVDFRSYPVKRGNISGEEYARKADEADGLDRPLAARMLYALATQLTPNGPLLTWDVFSRFQQSALSSFPMDLPQKGAAVIWNDSDPPATLYSIDLVMLGPDVHLIGLVGQDDRAADEDAKEALDQRAGELAEQLLTRHPSIKHYFQGIVVELRPAPPGDGVPYFRRLVLFEQEEDAVEDGEDSGEE